MAERAYLTWRHELLELFGSGSPLCARFPDESRTRYPLTLTIRVEAAINLVRLAYLLFAFKREAPIALTLPPRHYAAKRSTLSIALHKRRLRIFSLRIPFAQNVPKGTSVLSVDQNGTLTTSWVKGVWSAGKDVISDLGG